MALSSVSMGFIQLQAFALGDVNTETFTSCYNLYLLFPVQDKDSIIGPVFVYTLLGVFGVTTFLLGLLLLVVICFFANTNKGLRDGMFKTAKVSIKQQKKIVTECSCCCCSVNKETTTKEETTTEDDAIEITSKNGFSKEVALCYVESIESTLKFAVEDELIYDYMLKRKTLEIEPMPKGSDTPDTNRRNENGIVTLTITQADESDDEMKLRDNPIEDRPGISNSGMKSNSLESTI